MRLTDLYNSKKIAKLPAHTEYVLPNAMAMPTMNSYYDHYRYLVALAGYPDFYIPTMGPIQDHPLSIAYTDTELEMIKTALKSMGKEYITISSSKSQEPPDIHKVSPVRTFTDPIQDYVPITTKTKRPKK
jgi:hypothetical protein